VYFFLYFIRLLKLSTVIKLLYKLKNTKNLQKSAKITKNTNNHLSKKPINVREPNKVAYINLFRAVIPELFSDDNTRRENFRAITKRNIITIYRENYRYRTIQVNTIYKRKAQKILSVDLGESDRNKSEDYNNWKQAILKKEKRRVRINPPDPNKLFT